MRYPAQHKEETRERIVKAAARWFRREGSEGAAISNLMRDLKLTHGGFYRHFRSKEDLFVEAFTQSLNEIGDEMAAAADRAPKDGQAKALIDEYFSVAHCDDATHGCPLAALAEDVARRARRVRQALISALRSHITRLGAYLPGATEEERTRKAMMLGSGMAGTLSLIRAIPDDDVRRRALDDAKAFYLKAVTQ
jgi:TetR/AcrR family transcriptional regulator, transcriptional repressor for nem operon